MNRERLGIGCASGFWGDSSVGTPQLIQDGRVQYIVYDYLAEITMSILARARRRDRSAGYALDFVQGVMRENLADLASQGIRVISNAGGVNPVGCAAAIRELAKEFGLALRVAVVEGDDLLERAPEIASRNIIEMFDGSEFPAVSRIQSINVYLGAHPIARALADGADIVITGRCADSALVLAPCIHEFEWAPDDWDRLAAGSLAGHVLECGTQVTGGNFTDWQRLDGQFHRIGYPIALIDADGTFVCTKARNTGGLVTIGTVGEQILYELHDPHAYLLPDVVCDFSEVRVREIAGDEVEVSGARGYPAPSHYKVCLTHEEGFRGGNIFTFYGPNSDRKAVAYAKGVLARSQEALSTHDLGPYSEVCVELIGVEGHYGSRASLSTAREVDVKIAAKHANRQGIDILLKEMIGLGLSAPPGFTGFAGARPKASPVLGLFSFLLDKSEVDVWVRIEDHSIRCDPGNQVDRGISPETQEDWIPASPEDAGPHVQVPLVDLAWTRSGDKGDKANIGVIARRREYFPYICSALTVDLVRECFAHFLVGSVSRYVLPGLPALNFVLDRVLGGGGVRSLRTDPQGKGFAQLLLDVPVSVPKRLVRPESMHA